MAAKVSSSNRAFEYTATGVLGDKRNTMLTNELHLRSELGKTKGHGHKFGEGDSYTYGRANPPRDRGVAGALVWITPDESSTKKGTSKRKGAKTSDKPFGMPVRPSTPIHDILSFKFQDEWIAKQMALQQAKVKEARSKRVVPGSYRENHTSTLRNAMRQPEVEGGDKGVWQMNKFSNKAQSQLDTFRSESERNRALKNQEPALVEC